MNDAPVIHVAGSSYTQQPDSGSYIIAGQTLTKGGQITVSGTVVSPSPGGRSAAVGTSVEHRITAGPAVGWQSEPVLTLGGSTYAARPGYNDFVIHGQTLTQGGRVTVSGVVLSYPTGGSFVIVGSSTQQLAAVPAAELTFGGSTYTTDAGGAFVVEGQTLAPGGVVTFQGTPISYASNALNVVIGSSTQFFAAFTEQEEPTVVFEGSTYTANTASDFVIAGQTLTPGGVITADGTAISYATDALGVVIGSSTQFFATPRPQRPTISIKGSGYTANAASDFVIAGQTLTPGGVITADGIAISYASDALGVVIGSSTQFFTTPKPPGPTISVAGSEYTANAATDFVIAGQTLTPGGAITVDGTPISYAADKSDVVIGTSTEAVGLGSYIIGGFGNGIDSASNTAAQGGNHSAIAFTGRASGRYEQLLGRWRTCLVVFVMMLL